MKKKSILLSKITYKCNDSCPFCISYNKMRGMTDSLPFADFKKNLDFFIKKTNLAEVVLTGGEPTLHPEFFDILKYSKKAGVAVKIITNAIRFSDKFFLKKTKAYIIEGRENKDIIFFSLNNLPSQVIHKKRQEILKKRQEGITNLVKSGIPLSCIVTITKENKRYLSEIIDFLIRLKKKYAFNLRNLELRMIYAGLTPSCLLDSSLVSTFDEIGLSLEKALDNLKKNGVNYTLWNIPLCYLNNPIYYKCTKVEERLKRVIIKIDVEHQYDKAEIFDWGNYLKGYTECRSCSLDKYCSGIEPVYLDLYRYPPLKKITKAR